MQMDADAKRRWAMGGKPVRQEKKRKKKQRRGVQGGPGCVGGEDEAMRLLICSVCVRASVAAAGDAARRCGTHGARTMARGNYTGMKGRRPGRADAGSGRGD